MYLNPKTFEQPEIIASVKPGHEMYLNDIVNHFAAAGITG